MPRSFPSSSHPPSFIVPRGTIIASPVLLFHIISHGMQYPFGQSGSVVLVLSNPNLLCTPASSLARKHEKLKSPWLCLSTAQQQLNISVLSTLFFSEIQNTASYQPLWRKLTLIHVKTGHPGILCSCRKLYQSYWYEWRRAIKMMCWWHQ